MIFREAVISDIKDIQFVRSQVKENLLSAPQIVSDQDCEDFLIRRGKGWVCESGGRVVGFGIVDLLTNNIRALFVLPEYEGCGIGKKLHDMMLHWYFNQTQKDVWLGTAPDTRAGKFYEKAGWKVTGTINNDETRFEMSYEKWKKD